MNNKDFELIEGDIRSFHIVREAVKGMDYILHQGALPSVPSSISDPITTNEVNILGTLNILEAAKEFEGYETTAIRINENILTKPYNTRLVCCTYHNQNDANELEELFKNYG